MSKTCEIKNLKTDEFKNYLSVSQSVKTKDDVISFELSNDKLTGTSNNQGDTTYKHWSVKLSDISESNNIPDGRIKCSLFKGNEIAKKILGYFKDTVNVKFTYTTDFVDKIELYQTGDNGKKTLSITIVCADDAAYTEFDDEIMDAIFHPTEDRIVLSGIELTGKEIDNIINLSGLTTNPEQQRDYITFYTQDGWLKATDDVFDIRIRETDVVIENDVEISKDNMDMLDVSDDYEIIIFKIVGGQGELGAINLKSKTHDVSTTVVLLTDISDKSGDSGDSDDYDEDSLFNNL